MDRRPMERLPPEPELDSDASMIVRVGFVVAGGVIASIACSLPAALRMGDTSSIGSAFERWLVLSSLATPAAVAAVAVLRRARVGLKLLVGDGAWLLAMGVLWWCIVELALLSVFGAILRKTTHQHALAGVTFAAVAVVSGALVGLFAHRVTRILAGGARQVPRVGLTIAGATAFIAILLVGVRTSRAEDMHTASAMVDALAFAVMSTIASSRLLLRLRALAIAGVPVAVLLIMIGFTTLRFDPELRESLATTAPMHCLGLDLFGR
jgi:hypothetical protein